jgi:tetratricopeptide (TPR) repeat protein
MSQRSRAIDEAGKQVRILLAAGKITEAEQLCQRIIATSPNHADTMGLLAMLTLRLGQPDTAAEWLRRAIAQKPAAAASYIVPCALTLLELGYPDRALAASQEALGHRANHPEALQAAGHALSDLGRPVDAVDVYAAALRGKPLLFDIENNLALALRESDRLEEAEAMFRRASAREPKDVALRANHASMLKDLGRLDEAEVEYREALRLDPGNALVHYNLGIALLLAGRFTEGFFHYAWRFAAGVVADRGFSQPAWNGEALGGKTLLIHAEQGLGDTIQMARFLSHLPPGGVVVVEAPRPLVRLLTGIPRIRVVQKGETLPPFDLHCPMMSLPAMLATELGTIPADTPYLRVDATRAAHWQRQVSALPGLHVGIAWAGNPDDVRLDRKRSVALTALAPLAAIDGVSFVSLQLGKPGEGLAASAFGPGTQDWTTELQDLAETASLIEALDLVISVDTAVAHLAGALGRPVWLLNRFDTDWRWLLGRDDCPWYPTLRQFRQAKPGDWAGIVERVATELGRAAV